MDREDVVVDDGAGDSSELVDGVVPEDAGTCRNELAEGLAGMGDCSCCWFVWPTFSTSSA